MAAMEIQVYKVDAYKISVVKTTNNHYGLTTHNLKTYVFFCIMPRTFSICQTLQGQETIRLLGDGDINSMSQNMLLTSYF